MLAFSLLLLAITGLLAAHSGFALAPMNGLRSLLPLSLIIIATINHHVHVAALDHLVVPPGGAVPGHQPLGFTGSSRAAVSKG